MVTVKERAGLVWVGVRVKMGRSGIGLGCRE